MPVPWQAQRQAAGQKRSPHARKCSMERATRALGTPTRHGGKAQPPRAAHHSTAASGPRCAERSPLAKARSGQDTDTQQDAHTNNVKPMLYGTRGTSPRTHQESQRKPRDLASSGQRQLCSRADQNGSWHT